VSLGKHWRDSIFWRSARHWDLSEDVAAVTSANRRRHRNAARKLTLAYAAQALGCLDEPTKRSTKQPTKRPTK
jgi:hypothetical protein